MKIFLVGATGRTGKWILKAALERGIQVTSLVREPTDRLDIVDSQLTVIPGDLLETQNLASLLAGHDAIISVLSSAMVDVATTRIISAAESAGVSRFIGLAGGGILQLDEFRLRRERAGYPEVFVQSSARHLRAWKALDTSSLEWTLFCTPDLRDASATGNAKIKIDYMPEGGKSIARGDVAEIMLGELKDNKFVRLRVGLTT